jgi:hypothetical protein
MKKNALLAAVLIITVVSAIVFGANAGITYLLSPKGRIRVAIRSFGDGYARWEPTAPRVFEGSFSVRLNSGTGGGSNGGGIFIGPLSWPLRLLTPAAITYWVYHIGPTVTTPDQDSPYVNLVLDNGLTIEGFGAYPSPSLFTYQSDQGYPSANWWVQMRPQDKFYSSFATTPGGTPTDPRLTGTAVANCDIHTSCTLATWQGVFPTAKVIQVQIFFGLWTEGGQTVCVDGVSIPGGSTPIEPEAIGPTTAY